MLNQIFHPSIRTIAVFIISFWVIFGAILLGGLGWIVLQRFPLPGNYNMIVIVCCIVIGTRQGGKLGRMITPKIVNRFVQEKI